MYFHSIKSTQHLPITLEEAWGFFSSPYNLPKITPPEMGFIITSDKKDAEKIKEKIQSNDYCRKIR